MRGKKGLLLELGGVGMYNEGLRRLENEGVLCLDKSYVNQYMVET